MNTPRVTWLQARVMTAVRAEWSDSETVAMRCAWGEERCRRDMSHLRRVFTDLVRKGLIEQNERAEVRRVGGAA